VILQFSQFEDMQEGQLKQQQEAAVELREQNRLNRHQQTIHDHTIF